MTDHVKYLSVEWNGWDYVVHKIESDEELLKWLKDGSLEEGEEVYLVTRMFIVRKNKQEDLVLVET